MHHEARGKEHDFILCANAGSFYVLVLFGHMHILGQLPW